MLNIICPSLGKQSIASQTVHKPEGKKEFELLHWRDYIYTPKTNAEPFFATIDKQVLQHIRYLLKGYEDDNKFIGPETATISSGKKLLSVFTEVW